MVPFDEERRFGVLAEKTNESDAIFAKHVFVFRSYPVRLGRPRAKWATLQAKRGCFSEGSERIVCARQKASRQSARKTETRPGRKCEAQTPSAGITLKPSQTRER